MNQEALDGIREAIEAWKSKKNFTFENKKVLYYKSPISNGEYLLRFNNSLNSFLCDGKLIEIELFSKLFHTATLGENSISENPKGDKYRLEKFLEDFDKEFYEEFEKRLSDCVETLKTTDPLFF